ncbi:hypothetical protein [Aureispira sp. CCB-E]|uniref:hypothetical protein n=1 Tax=Aureispira sp. CCB-E TaxID=3051121 RepID=UPI00286952B4|nr:hypothetical protein [Aureispira sp. CCB-E]WMX13212.1 hypothetical protein QP953_20420 [Aureispira sp. CCB-E]
MNDKIDIFYAMEYINIIGNRILKVWITPKYIFAAKVKGFTSEYTGISFYDQNLAIHPLLRLEPKAYVNSKEENKYSRFFFEKMSPQQFMRLNKENFVIHKNKIKRIDYTKKKKWGMGNYPHTGRIFIKTEKNEFNKKNNREFIIIADQNIERIMSILVKNHEI